MYNTPKMAEAQSLMYLSSDSRNTAQKKKTKSFCNFVEKVEGGEEKQDEKGEGLVLSV